jgi:hypothetical protein
MARQHIYRTYRWITKDPIIDAIRTVVKSDEHLKNSQVHALSGVATATLDNWFDGETRKPQNSTICAVSTALGYVRADRIRSDGTLAVGFKKDKALDYGKEIEKQADWVLQHAQPKKPRKKKAKNGKAAP